MQVIFEISNRDLARFRSEMRRGQKLVVGTPEADTLSSAEVALAVAAGHAAPDFIRERLPRLGALIGMLRDSDWRLPRSQRTKILSVLAYFSDPDDLIPDVIPGLGLLDDAIMIELILRDLHHDIQAFEDFCHYRDTYFKRHKIGRDAVTRAKRLQNKRKDLLERSNRRKRRDRGQGTQRAIL